MESFLRRKLGQTGGNILGGSSLQKPVSCYQPINLPDLCTSFYSIADEPFPQVSGFLDDTVGPSFLSNEAGTALNSPACTPSERIKRHKEEEVLTPRKETTNNSIQNCSMLEGHCQTADGNASIQSLQNAKDITTETTTTYKTDRDRSNFGTCATVSTTSLEKCELLNLELKNSTFDMTQDSKEPSDTGINSTVDLPNNKEKSDTFDFVQSQELKKGSEQRHNLTVDVEVDVPIIKTEPKNTTYDPAGSHDSKDGSALGANATVDIPNLDCTHAKINSFVDNSGSSCRRVVDNMATEQPNERLETIDIQPCELNKERQGGSLNTTVDIKINDPLTKSAEEASLRVDEKVDPVEQNVSAPLQTSGEVVQSSPPSSKPDERTFTKHNATTDLTPQDNPVSKNTTVEIKSSSAELTGQADVGSDSVVDQTKSGSDNRETEDEISTPAFVCSVEAPDDLPEPKSEDHHKISGRPRFADIECIPPSDLGNISRNSLFSLDDTLDMKTSFLVTSTPIIFGKESRFELLRDAKATTMRKRLSVINSIEAQSHDDLVGVSKHEGTDIVQMPENSSQSQKISTNCTSGHSTSEPANENKAPTKPTIRRKLPQLSSKLSHPKASLPPRPQSTLNTSGAVKPKTVQGLQVPQQSDTATAALLGNRKTVQPNKGKNIGTVKNTAASTVKTSMVSSAPGYSFTAVSKPSNSAIPQMKPSGLQPSTRKRLGLKTPQATLSTVETVPAQSCNKPTGLPGVRTRNSLLPSLAQKQLNNDGLPSAKRKRTAAPTAQSAVENNAVHSAEGTHESDCVNCLQHQERFERCLQELVTLRSDCKNLGPLQEKLEMFLAEFKRI